MRSQEEIERAIENLKRQEKEIDELPCPSERQTAVTHLPKMKGEREALEWVLYGKQPVLLVSYFVADVVLACFRDFLLHYDDDQEEAQAEADQLHYEEWLDTRNPGDEFPGRPDYMEQEFQASVWVEGEEESEFGSSFTLGFPGAQSLFSFGKYWGKKLAELEKAFEEPES